MAKRILVPVDLKSDGDAVVMLGHGPVCFGADLAAALERAVALEEEARRYRSGSEPSR